MDRRESLKMIALAPLAAGFSWTPFDVEEVHRKAGAARTAGAAFEPQFFTAHEYKTVGVLADMILPADDHSGSATALGVPEFMDFMVGDRSWMQVPMRGGLAWLDTHSRRRFGKPFVEGSEAERRGVLDEIAYPDDVADELSHGAAFFNSFRDLTASGFWTTKEGMADLGYQGNTFVLKWEGAPEAEIARLGLEPAPWKTK